ncbi:chorismate mutase [Ferrimonas aestuarii]|uniref:Bifunctional chorismate mutase/prephenate dehydratase n=1 Tax=Ferrimonas aestuarii TaxID=2569539 RepID=A0A4U1BQW9_9GAMM|nr:chorismate mutase [Ferrimonas aestuarii]TKB55324.1 chorismate mutase [Ferrimonas aestuarii]
MDLNQIRKDINQVDSDLLKLLAHRRQLTLNVARSKEIDLKPVRDQEREAQLLEKLVAQGKEQGLDAQYVVRIFQTVIEDSVLRQQAWLQGQQNTSQDLVRVAYLGAKGSYSYVAAHGYFTRRDKSLIEMGFPTFDEVVRSVERGNADYGILPLENTSSGSINEVYDLLQQTSLQIVGETTESIGHCLLTLPGANLDEITTIYAHPQVISQCSNHLRQYPNIKLEYCSSSAHAMAQVANLNDPSHAAIASQAGGELYGLDARIDKLANQAENESRFIVVSRKALDVPVQVPAKTTLIMATGQKSGSLVDALLILKQNGLIMSKLTSRPIPGNPWEEMFYLDVEANINSDAMKQAMAQLVPITRFIKVLGCYQSERIIPTEIE